MTVSITSLLSRIFFIAFMKIFIFLALALFFTRKLKNYKFFFVWNVAKISKKFTTRQLVIDNNLLHRSQVFFIDNYSKITFCYECTYKNEKSSSESHDKNGVSSIFLPIQPQPLILLST